MCPVFVRYRFLRNHLTKSDETLHALFTLPKDDVRPKKNFDFSKKKIRQKKFFKNFSKIFKFSLLSISRKKKFRFHPFCDFFPIYFFGRFREKKISISSIWCNLLKFKIIRFFCQNEVIQKNFKVYLIKVNKKFSSNRITLNWGTEFDVIR